MYFSDFSISHIMRKIKKIKEMEKIK